MATYENRAAAEPERKPQRLARQSCRCRRCAPAMAFLLAGLLLSGCTPKVVRVPVSTEDIIKANQAVKEADLAFARRDFYAALIKYLEGGRLNPNSEFIQNKIGIAYSQLKFYQEATGAFQRSIGLNPKYHFAYNNLGTVYFAMNEKGKAEKHFKKAISLRDNIASFHINMATLLFEKKKYEKGMAELRKGLAIDPNVMEKSEGISLSAATERLTDKNRSYSMARAFAAMGDVERALEQLQLAFNAGFTDFESMLGEADFDPIREDERFVAFMKTASLLFRP